VADQKITITHQNIPPYQAATTEYGGLTFLPYPDFSFP